MTEKLSPEEAIRAITGRDTESDDLWARLVVEAEADVEAAHAEALKEHARREAVRRYVESGEFPGAVGFPDD